MPWVAMKRWSALLLLPMVALASTAQAQGAARVVPPALAPASPEQLEAAERVFYGAHDCAFGAGLDVALDPHQPGYVAVRYGTTRYLMKPVLSSTGAIRLEDVKGAALLVQIPAKSMLMDVEAGRRMADDCISKRHREAMAAQAAQKAPAALPAQGALALPPPVDAEPVR